MHLDAEMPIADVARNCRLQQHTVRRILQKLIQTKRIIPSLLVNTFPFGGLVIAAYFSLTPHKSKTRDKLLTHIKRHPEVSWLQSLLGEFEYVAHLNVSNLKNVETFFSELTDSFGHCVAKRETAVVLDYVIFGRRYLLPSTAHTKSIFIEMGDTLLSVDHTDKRIISLLISNPLSPVAEIARSIGLPSSTVSYRINRLKEEKIIAGSVFYINPLNASVSAFQVLIDCGGATSNNAYHIVQFLKATFEVVSFHRVFGSWDLEFCVELPEEKTINQFISDFLDTCREKVYSCRVLHRQEEYKWESAPMGLLLKV